MFLFATTTADTYTHTHTTTLPRYHSVGVICV